MGWVNNVAVVEIVRIIVFCMGKYVGFELVVLMCLDLSHTRCARVFPAFSSYNDLPNMMLLVCWLT
jgi:hypothetical protein